MSALAVLGVLTLSNLAVMPVHALAFTFIVDTKGDLPDADVANPACADLSGQCSLRAAVMQANALDPEGGYHTIKVGPVDFTMDIENTAGQENQAEEGDYDIWVDVHIEGAGPSKTFIQAGASAEAGLDRIFDIRGANVDVTISGMTIRYGNAGSSNGGAIAAIDPTQSLRLEDVVIEDNTASNSGVAIYSRADTTIVDSVIRNNHGRNSTIEMDGGSLLMRRSTISGNTTQLNASAIRLGFEAFGTVERTTISGNTSGTGGPILVGRSNVDDSVLTLRNSTISGNTAPGAMIASFAEGTTTVLSSTIAGNTGRGIDLNGPSSFKNTILAGNSLGNCASDPTSAGYNLDSGTSCGFGGPGDIENGSAKLGALAYNGGPTRTRALGLGSDARDAGSGCPDQDQRGYSRPKDGDGNGVATCDIGAYEAAKVAAAATAAPSLAPTLAPTEAPTEAPPTTAPTAEPTLPAATEAPTVPAASVAPSPESTPGAPATTVAPGPAGNGESGGPLLWIVLAIVAVAIAFGLGFGLRRRRAGPPTTP